MALLDYVKTAWQNDAGPDIDSTNLNHLEDGVYNVSGELKRRIQYVTVAQFDALTPADGDEVFLRISTGPSGTGDRFWRLRYDSSNPTAYKWQFVGGAALAIADVSSVDAIDLTGGNGPGLLAGNVSLTVPRGGVYRVCAGADVTIPTFANGQSGSYVELSVYRGSNPNPPVLAVSLSRVVQPLPSYEARGHLGCDLEQPFALGDLVQLFGGKLIQGGTLTVSVSNKSLSLVPVRLS